MQSIRARERPREVSVDQTIINIIPNHPCQLPSAPSRTRKGEREIREGNDFSYDAVENTWISPREER